MTDITPLSGSYESKREAVDGSFQSTVDGLPSEIEAEVSSVWGDALNTKHDKITAEETVSPAPTDAPSDAYTDYNVVTTLLGALVGAVNDANAKQNQIAEKLNSTAEKLNALIAKIENMGLME